MNHLNLSQLRQTSAAWCQHAAKKVEPFTNWILFSHAVSQFLTTTAHLWPVEDLHTLDAVMAKTQYIVTAASPVVNAAQVSVEHFFATNTLLF